MPPCLGGKSLVTISVRRISPASVGGTGAVLWPGGTVDAVRVPGGGHRDLAHHLARRWRVDDLVVAYIHGDVSDAVVIHQVTRLKRGQGNVRKRRPLTVGVPRYREARGRPGRQHQPRAVEAVGARACAAIDVGAAELPEDKGHRLLRLGRGRALSLIHI